MKNADNTGGDVILKAHDKQGMKIIADNATKNETYYCPICDEELILKQGLIKVPHYAHKPDSTCKYDFWEPESPRHQEMKRWAYNTILKHNQCDFADYEYQIDNLIADVYFEIKHRKEILKVAVECQCSTKSLDDLIIKTRKYTDNDIHTLWLFNFPDKWKRGEIYLKDEIRPSEIMKECHKLYYGRIYTLWENKLMGVHFCPVEREKQFFDWGLREMGWDYEDCFTTYTKTLKSVKHPFSYNIRNCKLLPSDNSGKYYENDHYLLARFYDKKWW